MHLDAVGAQRLAQPGQRVVAGLTLRRQGERLGHPFVGAQVEDRQWHADQHQQAQQQRPEQARAHACHPYCWRSMSASVSTTLRLGRRPP
ncbi:hypothetical protein G6F60_015438 [Rhizopus arrhizus]|nr:hypothetical protein G6F60_015438 [Rhizopus arrhizus]